VSPEVLNHADPFGDDDDIVAVELLAELGRKSGQAGSFPQKAEHLPYLTVGIRG
jgi:hypothetical protein